MMAAWRRLVDQFGLGLQPLNLICLSVMIREGYISRYN
jgi:hypothetical protein